MSDDDEKAGSAAQDEDEEGEVPPSPQKTPTPIISDPYAILKVERNADEETIQRSYKRLSRTFHPDKHPPGAARDAAQEVFISFKNAHDILTDPVQRQAYDDHGPFGVNLVKRSMQLQDKDPSALYSTLATLHQFDRKEHARLHLKDALQHLEFESQNQNVQFGATLEFPCTTVSTTFMGEGKETVTVPELQGAHVSFSVTSASPTPDNKWSVTAGGSTNVQNGKGEASGQVSVGYKPVQGTHVNVDLDLGNPYKLSVGSTRKLTSRTVVTTKVSTMPKSKNLSFSVVTQRALFQNQYLGTCALGMGTDLAVHYYLLSCTTLWSGWPQFTAKFNVGVDSHPLKVSAKHEFGNNGTGRNKHTGIVSYAWGPMGIEVKAIVDRALSSYATLSLGIQHATRTGLTWLLALQRGDVSFRIPIHVSAITSPGYSYKVLMLAFLSGLMDRAVQDVLDDATLKLVEPITTKGMKRESSWMELDKTKQDAEEQKTLMTKTANACRERERSQNGLVILKAIYWVDGGESMDATIQLQFFVADSRLKLPSTPKSHLLGFYSLAAMKHATEQAHFSWWNPWHRFWRRKEPSKPHPVPKLTVRYEMGGHVYEITLEDDEELVIPNQNALFLGQSGIVS